VLAPSNPLTRILGPIVHAQAGRKSLAESVALAKALAHKKPKGGKMSVGGLCREGDAGVPE
jgi:hypothetical protein